MTNNSLYEVLETHLSLQYDPISRVEINGIKLHHMSPGWVAFEGVCWADGVPAIVVNLLRELHHSRYAALFHAKLGK